jgi:hypothetical protein
MYEQQFQQRYKVKSMEKISSVQQMMLKQLDIHTSHHI